MFTDNLSLNDFCDKMVRISSVSILMYLFNKLVSIEDDMPDTKVIPGYVVKLRSDPGMS